MEKVTIKLINKIYNLYIYSLFRIHLYYISNKVDTDPIIYSSHWMAAAIVCNIITIIHICCSILNIEYHFLLIILLYFVFFIINHTLLKNNYEIHKKKIKFDNKLKQKGWLVFMYILLSFIIYILSLALFNASVKTPLWIKKFNFNIIGSILNK